MKTENGVSQSSGPPAYARFTTAMPPMKPPSVTPWKNVATTEPPMNALSHQCRCASSALKRNSNATPRKMRPSSMKMSGR